MQQAEKTDVSEAPAIVKTVELKGLTWDARETKRLTFKEAEEHVAAMNAASYAGFTDWRLPTYYELTGLVDVIRYDPAIDTDKFPGCKSDWYWTGTPAAYSPADDAWLVYFLIGNAGWSHRDIQAFVRAVRPSQ